MLLLASFDLTVDVIERRVVRLNKMRSTLRHVSFLLATRQQ